MDMLEKIKADPVGEAKTAIKNPDWFDCAYEDAMVRGLLAEAEKLQAVQAVLAGWLDLPSLGVNGDSLLRKLCKAAGLPEVE